MNIRVSGEDVAKEIGYGGNIPHPSEKPEFWLWVQLKITLKVEVVWPRGTPLPERDIDFLRGTEDLLRLRLWPWGWACLELLEHWLVATGSFLLKSGKLFYKFLSNG